MEPKDLRKYVQKSIETEGAKKTTTRIMNSIGFFSNYKSKFLNDNLKNNEEIENSFREIIDVYRNLVEEAPDLSYYNIEQLTVKVEEDMFEEVMSSDLMVGSNVGLDVYIINRMVTNEFGRAAGSESGLILGNFAGINEQPDTGLDETAEDGNDGW